MRDRANAQSYSHTLVYRGRGKVRGASLPYAKMRGTVRGML